MTKCRICGVEIEPGEPRGMCRWCNNLIDAIAEGFALAIAKAERELGYRPRGH